MEEDSALQEGELARLARLARAIGRGLLSLPGPGLSRPSNNSPARRAVTDNG